MINKCQPTLAISKKAFFQGSEKFLPSFLPNRAFMFTKVIGGMGGGKVSERSSTTKMKTTFMLGSGITMKGIVKEATCYFRMDSTKEAGRTEKCMAQAEWRFMKMIKK